VECFKSDPHAFNRVIIDMTIPGMIGDELARKVIKIREDIPIILCNGYTNKLSRHHAHALGIKAFVQKPVGIVDLAEIIRNVLDDGSSLHKLIPINSNPLYSCEVCSFYFTIVSW